MPGDKPLDPIALTGIKIVSNGEPFLGTKVLTQDGHDLVADLKVFEITWSQTAGERPIVIIKCRAAMIEAENVTAVLADANRLVDASSLADNACHICNDSTLADKFRRYIKR